MQKHIMIKIFIIIGILFSTLLSADQIVSREGDIVTVVASGEYIMGDSDNRKEARTMALTQAKTNASEVAGTYIESNFESVTKQTNGDTVDKVTKQELRSFSAAILQSEITNDTMEMLANKTTVYKVSIKARIDLATLRERVKQLGEDKAKKDRLIGLEKENKDLSFALEKLSEQMRTLESAKLIKPEEIRALREERDRLFTKLEKNEGATKLVFEKGSVLNEYQERVAKATEIANEVNAIFDNHLSEYVKVNIGKPKIVSQTANMFTLQFESSASFDMEKFLQSKAMVGSSLHLQIDSKKRNLYLNYKFYEDSGIDTKILRDLVHVYVVDVVFLLPDGAERRPLFSHCAHDGDRIDGLGLINLSYYSGRESENITFKMTQDQLSQFSEINVEIDVQHRPEYNCSVG